MIKKQDAATKKPQSDPLWKRELRYFWALPKIQFIRRAIKPFCKKTAGPIIKPILGSLRIIWWIILPVLMLLSFISWAIQRSWKAASNHKVFATILAIGASSVIAGIFHVYTNIQLGYANIESDLRNMANAYETIYSFCGNVIKTPHKLSYFEKRRLATLNDRLNEALVKLNDDRIALGKLTNLKTYLTLHGIACWTNSILSRSIYACAAKLIDRKQMDQWRDRAIAQVIANKKIHQGFYHKYLKDPFDYYFGKDPSDETYKNPGCNLEKLNEEIRNIKLSKRPPPSPYCQFNSNYQLICYKKPSFSIAKARRKTSFK